MMRLIYTPRSLEDFDRILEYIARDNPSAAVRLGEDLLEACELLKSHPLLGEAIDDLATGLRRFVCRGYGIYYRVDEELQAVYIGRFLHPRIDVAPERFE